MVTAILALGVHFFGAWILSEKLRAQHEYGEADPERWSREYAAYFKKGELLVLHRTD